LGENGMYVNLLIRKYIFRKNTPSKEVLGETCFLGIIKSLMKQITRLLNKVNARLIHLNTL